MPGGGTETLVVIADSPVLVVVINSPPLAQSDERRADGASFHVSSVGDLALGERFVRMVPEEVENLAAFVPGVGPSPFSSIFSNRSLLMGILDRMYCLY